jgi:hypothetical protein
VHGPLQHPVAVAGGEVWRQLGDGREMEAAVTQHGQQHGVLPGRPGHGDAQVGLVLREMKHLGAVDEHRRRGLSGVEPPGVDFGNEGDKVCFDAAGLPHDLGKTAE